MNDKKNASLSKQHLKIWLRLLRLNKVITNDLREKLHSQYDTTLPRFDVMATLHQFRDGLKMSQLSSVLRVSNGNVTSIIDKLERDGLVTREINVNDRRSYTVKLSEKGFQDFELQAHSHEQWIHNIFKNMSSEKCESFLDDVNTILVDKENAKATDPATE